jgi:hypothetical protein
LGTIVVYDDRLVPEGMLRVDDGFDVPLPLIGWVFEGIGSS